MKNNDDMKKKLYKNNEITGDYLMLKDFVDIKGRKAIKGRTGRAILCPDTVEYLDFYADEVTYIHRGKVKRNNPGLLLVDVSDLGLI